MRGILYFDKLLILIHMYIYVLKASRINNDILANLRIPRKQRPTLSEQIPVQKSRVNRQSSSR